MEIVNRFPVFNMIFILLHCPFYMKADCSVKEYKVFPDGYIIRIKMDMEPFFKPNNEPDRTQCFKLCALEIFCHIWTFDNGTCHIFHSMNDTLEVIKSNNSSLKTYYETKEGDKWFKMYFVKSGSGFRVADSFLGNGTYESWGPEKCTRTRCSNLFRSNLIDVWGDLPIDKVKLVARRTNKNVPVVFDGKNSTKENWFSMSRVLKSPWNDFKNGTLSNVFDITSNHSKMFYISSSHNGCSKDVGWFFVTGPDSECEYEKYGTYPQIMYSTKRSSTIWYEDSLLKETESKRMQPKVIERKESPHNIGRDSYKTKKGLLRKKLGFGRADNFSIFVSFQ